MIAYIMDRTDHGPTFTQFLLLAFVPVLLLCLIVVVVVLIMGTATAVCMCLYPPVCSVYFYGQQKWTISTRNKISTLNKIVDIYYYIFPHRKHNKLLHFSI